MVSNFRWTPDVVESQMTLSRYRALVARSEARARLARGEREPAPGEMSREEFRDFLKKSGFAVPGAGRKFAPTPAEMRGMMQSSRVTAPRA